MFCILKCKGEKYLPAGNSNAGCLMQPRTLFTALYSSWSTFHHQTHHIPSCSTAFHLGDTLFLSRCWTLNFYLLDSMRLLSAHLLSLSRSFSMAAGPGFTCFSYLVNPALNKCSFSDRSSTAEQTNFSQCQQVSKTLDNFASPHRIYHIVFQYQLFSGEPIKATVLPQTCKEPRSL